jgi:hypothetical protein
MATNFTNKYMQVFQNYNEFGEHSADYVRGEDHIAFLIEENEVIYWLYLEQVWRPLNVRTTTTGELEDGRTKVAVRLEYVEGGQKYTSVPNIPDPERITSMSHFLEDYPDIEEVNVAGTVNLTDLSYAFAGSKIKDFSMLDTSNVTNIVGIFNNIINEELDLNIKLDINKIRNSNAQGGITVNSINFINSNKDDYALNLIYFKNCNINVLNLDDFSFDISVVDNDGLTIKTINSNKEVRFSNGITKANGNNEVNNINCDKLTFGVTSVKANNELIVNCNVAKINTYGQSNYITESKTIIETVNDLTFNIDNKGIISFKFGNGIKYPSNISPKLTRYDEINIANVIGNFWFTIPIVNDAFYADKQYAVSIFQYKTTFEEVADVNISSEVDSSLTYLDFDIDFDLSNTSIELYNNININTKNYSGTIKKLIVDNTNVDGIDKTNCPYLHDFYANRFKVIEGYVSGIFKSYNPNNESYARISESKLLKNIVLVDFIFMIINNGDFLKTNNIKFDYVKRDKYTKLSLGGNKLTELDTLINNNHIGVNLNCNYTGVDAYLRRIKNIDEVIFDIGNSIEDSETNIYIIIDLLFEGNNNNINSTIRIASGSPNNEQIDESIYINGNSKLIIFWNSSYKYDENNYVKYIYGNNLIISIDVYTTNMNEDWNLSPYKHIDINSVMTETHSNEFHILNFINCDNETLINLITKLVDNTSSSTATIYMYRSQSNIIGEENIAAAGAKNYEFAIIEN